MFEQGDVVKVKSLDEVLEIEGVDDIDDIYAPGIVPEMKKCFGKQGVTMYTNGSGEVKVMVDGEPWYYSPEWLDEVSDILTIKEFTKSVKDLGFDVVKEYNSLEVLNKDGLITMTIPLKHRGCVDTYWKGFTNSDDWETKSKLLELGVKLASTPIDKRNESKKYYLRLPKNFIGKKLSEKLSEHVYLNFSTSEKKYFFGNKSDTFSFKTQYTQEEIDKIDTSYLIKEEVKDV